MKLLCILFTFMNLYAQPATVVDVAAELVTVKTVDGNLWEYYGDATPGEKIILVMDNNGTIELTDDKIVGVL